MDVIDIKKYDDLKKDYEIYAENVSKKFKSIFNKINAIIINVIINLKKPNI